MSYDHYPSYDELLAHAKRHNIKEWLLRGAKYENAWTIHTAIERQSPHRLARKLAEILTAGKGNVAR